MVGDTRKTLTHGARLLAGVAGLLVGALAATGCAHYEATSPEPAQLARLRALDANAAVGVLNLFEIRPRARYAPGDPEFGTAAADVTGDAALDRYLATVAPLAEALGGRVVFDTPVDQVMIGPAEPAWNRAVLLYLPTRKAFGKMAANEAFRAARRHRIAASAKYQMLHLDGEPFAP